MAQLRKAHLPAGMTLLDFSSRKAIRSAFGGDMRAMRAEYSRERSIIRKRIERMAEAGETSNAFYSYYKNMEKVLPSARGLSDETIMDLMMKSAHGIGGGYKSTISELKDERLENIATLAKQAAGAGDREFARSLLNPKLSNEEADALIDILASGRTQGLDMGSITLDMSSKDYAKVLRIMGMVQKVDKGRTISSNTLYQDALKMVVNKGDRMGVLRMAAEVIHKLGIQLEEGEEEKATTREEARKALSAIYTPSGRQRASYKAMHRKRGR